MRVSKGDDYIICNDLDLNGLMSELNTPHIKLSLEYEISVCRSLKL